MSAAFHHRIRQFVARGGLARTVLLLVIPIVVAPPVGAADQPKLPPLPITFSAGEVYARRGHPLGGAATSKPQQMRNCFAIHCRFRREGTEHESHTRFLARSLNLGRDAK